jgi:hypothetical protein
MTRSEEELRVGTTEREAGRVRLKKYVVEEEVTQTVPVRREEVRDRAEKWRNGPSFFGGGQEPGAVGEPADASVGCEKGGSDRDGGAPRPDQVPEGGRWSRGVGGGLAVGRCASWHGATPVSG